MKIYLNSFKLVVHHLSERQKKSWGQKGVGHSGATEWEVLRIGAKAVAPGHVPLEAADFPWVTWSVPAAVLLPTPLFYPLPCGADRAALWGSSLASLVGGHCCSWALTHLLFNSGMEGTLCLLVTGMIQLHCRGSTSSHPNVAEHILWLKSMSKRSPESYPGMLFREIAFYPFSCIKEGFPFQTHRYLM